MKFAMMRDVKSDELCVLDILLIVGIEKLMLGCVFSVPVFMCRWCVGECRAATLSYAVNDTIFLRTNS